MTQVNDAATEGELASLRIDATADADKIAEETRLTSRSITEDFLTNAMPDIEPLLPDWKRVTSGQARVDLHGGQ